MEITINKNSSTELNRALASTFDKNNVGYELRLVNGITVDKITGLHITSDSNGAPVTIKAFLNVDKTWVYVDNTNYFILYTP